MTSVSSHVLDLERGEPRSGLDVVLEKLDTGEWGEVARARTDEDGRVGQLASGLDGGIYRLRVMIDEGFYPEIDVVVTLDGSEPHYHLPILLSPYGYSTYRGS
ncbi:MAG: hydroxyisourate hydrolase [Acidimicrobiia bacterium]